MEEPEPLRDRRAVPMSAIAIRVLRYLMVNPAAGDTVEGILDWWLTQSDRSIERQAVEQALNELERAGLITVLRAADTRSHYRLNSDRVGDARALLNEVNGG